MFGSLLATIGEKKDALEFKVTLYIIIGIVAIVVIRVLIDGIRKYIRGLDTAALGALFLWLGHWAAGVKVVSVVSKLLYIVGGTLFGVGLLVFVILQLIKRGRKKRIANKANRNQKPEKTEAKNDETPS